MTLHLYAQNPRKTIPRLENLAPKLGQDFLRSGKHALDLGEEIPTQEIYVSVLGQNVPTSGKHASDLGEGIPTQEKSASVLGQNVPTSGKHASDLGDEIPPPEKYASVLGQNVPTSELFLPFFGQVFILKKALSRIQDCIWGFRNVSPQKRNKKTGGILEAECRQLMKDQNDTEGTTIKFVQ